MIPGTKIACPFGCGEIHEVRSERDAAGGSVMGAFVTCRGVHQLVAVNGIPLVRPAAPTHDAGASHALVAGAPVTLGPVAGPMYRGDPCDVAACLAPAVMRVRWPAQLPFAACQTCAETYRLQALAIRMPVLFDPLPTRPAPEA